MRANRRQFLIAFLLFGSGILLISYINLNPTPDIGKMRTRITDCTIEIEKCISSINSSRELRMTLARISKQVSDELDFITIAFANSAYKDIANNWLCNWNSFPTLMNSTFIITLDLETKNFLSKYWKSFENNLIHVPLPDSAFSDYLLAGSEEASTLELLRWEIIRLILNSSPVPILVMDVDSVWLQHPIHLLGKLTPSHSDIWFTTKGFQEPDPRISNRSAGLMLLDPSASGLIDGMMERILVTAEYVEDALKQACDSLDPASNLTCGRIKWEDIPDGNWFDQSSSSKLSQPKPFAVHNNAVLGVAQKITRFKQAGFWFLNPDNNICSPKAVEMLLQSPSAYFGMGQIIQTK